LSALPCGAQTKSSLAPLQVRHTHAGKQNTRKLLRRKGHRHAYDGTEDARLSEPVPERCPTPHPPDDRLAEGNRKLPHLPASLWPAYFRRGEKREIVFQIRGQKVVDIVFTGIHSGHEGRPGNGGNGWKGSA